MNECHLTPQEYGKYQGCVNWNMFYTNCNIGPHNPFHGAVSFDNIGLAWVAIFLVLYIFIVLYNTCSPFLYGEGNLLGRMDRCYVHHSRHSFLLQFHLLRSPNNCEFVSNLSKFSIFFSKIGTFFMINLCLVVIANQFSETRRRETAKMKEEREYSSESSFSSFIESEDEEEETNLYRDIINLIHYYLRRLCYRIRKFKRVGFLELFKTFKGSFR